VSEIVDMMEVAEGNGWARLMKVVEGKGRLIEVRVEVVV
jgi:hypothetical protein